MRITRLLLLVLGVAALGVGALDLVQQPPDRLLAVAVWLAGGVVLHDGILAPTVVAAGVALTLLVPRWLAAPLATGAVILGTVTLVAVPVLGRFGARADDPTLLDRPYLTGWLVVAGMIVTGVGVAAMLVRRQGGG